MQAKVAAFAYHLFSAPAECSVSRYTCGLHESGGLPEALAEVEGVEWGDRDPIPTPLWGLAVAASPALLIPGLLLVLLLLSAVNMDFDPAVPTNH